MSNKVAPVLDGQHPEEELRPPSAAAAAAPLATAAVVPSLASSEPASSSSSSSLAAGRSLSALLQGASLGHYEGALRSLGAVEVNDLLSMDNEDFDPRCSAAASGSDCLLGRGRFESLTAAKRAPVEGRKRGEPSLIPDRRYYNSWCSRK